MNQNNKELLKSYIINRTKNITDDCKTFLYVRRNQNKAFKKNKLGGGNITMGIVLFSAIDFLSNIFYRLNNLKVKGRIKNDTKFLYLIKHCPIDLGISDLNDKEIKTLWNYWRDKLSHLVAPRRAILVTFDDNKSLYDFNSIQKQIETKCKSFCVINITKDIFKINVDKLTLDVEKISIWIGKEMNNYSEVDIERALFWVKSELGAK